MSDEFQADAWMSPFEALLVQQDEIGSPNIADVSVNEETVEVSESTDMGSGGTIFEENSVNVLDDDWDFTDAHENAVTPEYADDWTTSEITTSTELFDTWGSDTTSMSMDDDHDYDEYADEHSEA